MPYTYPIGVPAAWIEPDAASPARPSPWSSEIPGYYYVSWSTGTDSGRTYGTPAAPRKTIPNPVPAGSRVEVNGTYAQSTGQLFVTFDGSAGDWVAGTSGPGWVVGASESERFSFTGIMFLVGSYGCVEHFDNLGENKALQINSTTAGIGRKADHILVRHGEMRGTSSADDASGIVVNGNSTADIGTSEHIVIYDCEIHNAGLDTPDGSDPDKVGVFLTTYVRHIWVLGNEIYDLSGGGVGVTANTGSTQERAEYIYVGKNHIYDCWGTGCSTKSSRYVVYSQNHIHDIEDNGAISPSKGLSAQYGATEVWMVCNHIHDCAHGVLRVAGNNIGETLYVIGNVIHDIAPLDGAFTDTGYGEGGIALWGAVTNYVVGNTLVNVPNGIVSPALREFYIANNIISLLSEANGEHIYIDLTGASPSLTIENNCLYGSGGRIKVPGRSLDTVATLQSASLGSGNISTDPLLNADYSLGDSSPCIDTADTIIYDTLAALYETAFGASIEFDFSGNARVAGGGLDMGALEYGSTGVEEPEPEDPDALTGYTLTKGTRFARVGEASTEWMIAATPEGKKFTGVQSVTIARSDATLAPSTGSPGSDSVTVTPPDGATSFTFDVTPSASGTGNITFTNNAGMSNPAAVSFAAYPPDADLLIPTIANPAPVMTFTAEVWDDIEEQYAEQRHEFLGAIPNLGIMRPASIEITSGDQFS